MPFIPHTNEDTQAMLATIGIQKIDDLFNEIPNTLLTADLTSIPSGLSEMELSRLMHARAKQDGGKLCFIGAGAYEHHIPAAVWEIASRGEFLTAYTPYQAEASQGTLQLLYEYQTMMASLMGMELSNASLYDGASALAEAVLMAARLSNKKEKPAILVPRNLHPHYRQVLQSIVGQQDIDLLELDYDSKTGKISVESLTAFADRKLTALIIPQPNFFGGIEEVDALSNWAHEHAVLCIAVVNPIAMALLKPPGQWGKQGADIACGEGQPLGIPLASGGPYYGFLCSRKSFARQMPGRIVGRTVDSEGKTGFVLTLQAREQHIRRAKATSNICTNQGLMVTASTIHMSLLGPAGLRQVALACHHNATLLAKKLQDIVGIKPVFPAPFFHELVIRLPKPSSEVLQKLAKLDIQGGYALNTHYPELGETLLICATETKSAVEIEFLATSLRETLS